MMTMIEEQLDDILPQVMKPGRYTGGELNSITKNHDDVEVKYIIAFPDAYEIGMSNLACQIIYDLLNKRPDCVAERVYAPWPDMEKVMRANGVPLFTLETKTSCADFDLWGFALSFELSYTNVLNMLDLAGVPVRSLDRDAGKPDGTAYPIIFAGGHCTFNPEPMAPFIDVFVIGEAEEVLVDITETFKRYRDLPREELLLKIAQIDGCYVPRFYAPVYETEIERQARLQAAGMGEDEAQAQHDTLPRLLRTERLRDDVPAKIARRVVWDVDNLDYPTKPIIPFIEVVHDRISLEVMRGCTRGCRFCQAGMITRPVREKTPARLMELAEELVQNTGHEDISLVSLSTADYTRVGEVVTGLIDRYAEDKIGVSLPSLRADKDCVALVQEINKVRKTGLTFAPEAGSQRMRDVTNKGVTEENLFQACESAFSNGWQKVKLYFMISLPTETDEDVLAIGELAAKCAQIARRNGVKNPTITIGVSAFVPKPFTPFQWHGQDTTDEINRKQNLLKRSLRDRAVNYRPNDPTGTSLEAYLSLSDRRVADVIELAWKRGEAFTSWDEYLHFDVWLQAFADCGVDPRYFANRFKAYDEPMPWDHIDCGVTKAFLRNEDKKARQARFTPDCHTETCSFCQSCDRAYTDSAKGRKRIAELAAQGKTLTLTRADREHLGLQI
jgi:radical SAM family uncharacterized protein